MSEQMIPMLSELELDEINEEIAHAPYRHAVAIDALKIVQAHRGWVSDESIKGIARHLEMAPEELDGIATFYNLIFRQPVGDKIILLCNSITCWIKGCDNCLSGLTLRLRCCSKPSVNRSICVLDAEMRPSCGSPEVGD